MTEKREDVAPAAQHPLPVAGLAEWPETLVGRTTATRPSGAHPARGGSATAGTLPVDPLERLTCLVSALDAAAASLQEEQDAAAIPQVVGKALQALSIESQVSLFDTPIPASENADQAIASAVIRIAYLSISPSLRRTAERVIGRPVIGLPIPLARVSAFAQVVRTHQPSYLGDATQELRQVVPWIPPVVARQLERLAHATTSIIAPLLSRGRILGIMGVWADDLRPEDSPALGAFARQAGIALDNARLAQETERRAQRLATLGEIGRDIASTLEREQVLTRVVTRAAQALGAPQAGLWLTEPDTPHGGASPIYLAAHHVSSTAPSGPSEPLAQGLADGPALRAIQRRSVELCPDLRATTADAMPRRTRQTLLAQGHRGYIAAPVLTPAHGVIGALVAFAPVSGAFTEEDGAYLEAIGRHAAVAIEQAQLFRQVSAQMQRAETLASVALALERERELPALLVRIAQAARDLTTADYAGFLLRPAPDAPLEVAATSGIVPRASGVLRRESMLDLAVLRPLLEQGQTLRLDDALAAASGRESRLLKRAQIRALAAAPLTASAGWNLGGLVVGHQQPGAFAQEHVELLGALAAQAGAAIERTRALEEAWRRADELETVFASMADGVAIYDTRGVLLRMNAAGVRITRGQSRAGEKVEVRHRRFMLRHLDGTALRREERPSARAVRGDTFHDAVYRAHGEDGPETLISCTGGPLLSADGTLRGGVVVFRNVTEMRRLERRTHEALSALLQIAAILVSPMARPEGAAAAGAPEPYAMLRQICVLAIGVLDCDRVAINLVDPETLLIRPAAVAGRDPEHDARWVAEQRARLERGQFERFGAQDPEGARRLLGGEPVVADLTQPPYAQPVRSSGSSLLLGVPMRVENTLVGILALGHQRHLAGDRPHVYTDEEIAMAQGVAQLAALAVERERLVGMAAEVEALRTANALKEEFLSIASHELKTPLAILQARTQATQRRLQRMGHADAAAQFAPVQVAIDRMLALVRELLDTSRFEAGKLVLRVEPCDLGALVSEVVREAAETSERAIAVQTMPDGDLAGVWVAADRERLTQVVDNLLTNAIKYSPPDSPITVRIVRRAPSPVRESVQDAHDTRNPDAATADRAASGIEIAVLVADQGVGIPEDEVEHVFERFYRARTSSARQYGGLGVGLYIAATIVERHEGHIWAESDGPGQGSVFGFALPAIDPSPSPDPAVN